MGIPTQRHEPMKGSRAIEFEKHKANFFRSAPHPSTGLAHVDPRISSRAKTELAPMVHGGMTNQQRAGMAQGGLGHAVQVAGGGHTVTDSKNAIPSAYHEGQLAQLAAGVPHPKHRTVPTYPGQRSRTNSKHPNDL